MAVVSKSAGSRGGLAVEGVDLGGDGGVLVGDDAVGDAGVGEGHVHGAVAEQRGDRFEAHAAVDGLGGEGVAQLVGVDVADAGARPTRRDDAADVVAVERCRGGRRSRRRWARMWSRLSAVQSASSSTRSGCRGT